MSTVNERAEIIKRYSGTGKTWEEKVNKMSDAQVHAVYMRFLDKKSKESR